MEGDGGREKGRWMRASVSACVSVVVECYRERHDTGSRPSCSDGFSGRL